MDITGAIYGYSSKESIAFGVHLKCTEFEHLKIIQLKSGTTNVAELSALEYALNCIDNHNSYTVVLDTCNAYITRILQKDDLGKYVMAVEKNKELVEKVRSFVGSNVRVSVNRSEILTNLQQLVKSTKRND